MTSPLSGLRIGVTATRRSTQLSDALAQRGAEVLLGPTLAGDQPAPDQEIAADTRIILDSAPAWIVATSAVGMRLWVEAADRAGTGDEVRTLVRTARGVARGSKAVAGFVAVGARPVWTSPQETDADVADWLRGQVRPGDRVAVQLHGGRTHAYRHLLAAGIDVLTVLPYTSGRPQDPGPAHELIAELVGGRLDVVTFTSPNAARNLFAIAEELGEDVHAAVVTQLRGPTAVASIGPVTSAALEEEGVVVAITPRRHRTGDLLRSIEHWKSARSRSTAGPLATEVHLHADRRCVAIGGVEVELGPREYEILATMLRRRDTVVRPDEFAVLAWGHAAPPNPTATVRHQVARLRLKLDDTALQIETVRGVGYRLSERPAPPVAPC